MARFGEQLELLPPEWLYVLPDDNARRLAELKFYNRRAPRCYQVTGGARSHLVDLDDERDGCNCGDYAFRHQLCKHVIRALLAEGDRDVIAALRRLLPYPSRRSARGPA